MAKVAGGSGQGRVRAYKTGRMVKCSDEGCQRAMRYINLGDRQAEPPPWKCGLAPQLPKTGRIGQQKQSKR